LNPYTIAASGPTLDEADWDNLPENIIAVNAAINTVPTCCAHSVIDAFDADARGMPSGDTIRLVTNYTVRVSAARGIPLSENIWILEDNVDCEHCESPIEVAIRYAMYNGSTEIHFVGVDGGSGNAKSLDWHYDKLQDHPNRQHDHYSKWAAHVIERCRGIMAGRVDYYNLGSMVE